MHLLYRRFGHFIASRRSRHLFRRLAFFESLAGLSTSPVPRVLAEPHATELLRAADEEAAELLVRLQSDPRGLTGAEADVVRQRVGLNVVQHEQSLSGWRHLWLSYKNPFNLLLTALAVLSFLTDDGKSTVVISCMVALSTLIRFGQERRSNRAVQALKDLVSSKATVLRRDHQAADGVVLPLELPLKQLVPGDQVLLSAGDMVPADCRVLSAKDLFVSQSAMTGESLPVEKFATDNARGGAALEKVNLVFMGTNVVSGSARAVVVATGDRSYFGTLASHVTATAPQENAFQAGVNRVSWLLIRFALVMVPLVLLVNGFSKGNWTEAFLFALSIAVGLTPEMLPMIVTSTLARGAVQLSHKQVIVKRLDAIQSFGAMDVLCTDKTGTLTQDKIVLARHTDVFGAPSAQVLALAYLNSYYQTGLKNLLDHAVLDHVDLQTTLQLATHYRKVDEIPFDFQRRRMSVVVSEQDDHHELICKGAVEEVMGACSQVWNGQQSVPLDGAMLTRVQHFTQGLNQEGLRVVAVAFKEIPPDQSVYSVADESALTLIGFIAFLDPPKESTAPALQALAASGIQVKVLTGDNELVSAEVFRQVGLHVTGVVLGPALDVMDATALAATVERCNLFAKLSPFHKERIVQALRTNGHVVGFMGDGINDAPALHAADIGISVDTAVDIAKEAADIILLERSLLVLQAGVIEGRKTFSNMLKYIRMTASSNFGNVFSVLVASVFLPFLPMLPLQLLVQNLLYDLSQTAIPFDDVDAELVQQPLQWHTESISRFMLCFGPLSSLFDLVTFALMWFVFKADSVAQAALFQSGWFVVSLLTQTLIVHLIRTPRVAFVQSRAAWPVWGATVLVMLCGLGLVQGPLATYFKLQGLPSLYFPCLFAILFGYFLLVTGVKRLYIRRFGWQ